jgi:glycosyltransferase involved in cell wall biosynthesis
MRHILLYADVDLNLIDGSSIWLTSLAQVLAGIPHTRVTVLQRTPLVRDVVIREARSRGHVEFVDPWTWATADPSVAGMLGERRSHLDPRAAAQVLRTLQERERHQLIIVRSIPTAHELLRWPELATRTWLYVTDPVHYRAGTLLEQVREAKAAGIGLLCQTEETRDAFRSLFGDENGGRFRVLPPMIPELRSTVPRLDPDRPRLVYSGKFSTQYRILEMLTAFDRIRERRPGAVFHVIGDKFNTDPSAPRFARDVKARLLESPNVVWHRGVSRSETTAILKQAHVGASWRDASFDRSTEISTKTLEYAALGLPVLLNPTPIQRGLFGDDYPTYVQTEDDFVEAFLELCSDSDLYQRVARQVQEVASSFTFDEARGRLAPMLESPLVSQPR